MAYIIKAANPQILENGISALKAFSPKNILANELIENDWYFIHYNANKRIAWLSINKKDIFIFGKLSMTDSQAIIRSWTFKHSFEISLGELILLPIRSKAFAY